MSEAAVVNKGDLTQGPIIKKMLLFSMPMILGNLIFQLYNVVDSVIVGNFVGSDALAAVNASFPIMMLFNSLFMGISTGAGIVVAQTFGAKNYSELQRVTNTSFALSYLAAVVITVVGLLFSEPLLRLLQTPENIMADSAAYLKIVYIGTIGSMGYNMGAGVLRGVGDSRWPLIFLTICAVLNVILDLVFVVWLDMAVAGVAWATILSQYISCVLVHIRINQGKYPMRVTLKTFCLDKGYCTTIVKLGVPAALQNMAMSLGSVFIQTFANGFGSNFIASNSVVMKVDGFAVLPMMGYGMALSTFVGQNVGAKKLDRTKKGIEYSILLIIGFGLVLGALLWFFGKYMMRAFTQEEIVLQIGSQGLRILAFFYTFMGLNQTLSGAMRGAGASVMPMVASVVSTGARIPIAYFLAVQPNNPLGLFWSMVCSMVINFLIIFLYYLSGKWKNKAVVK